MAIWERSKIVKFFQDRQTKAETKAETHGKHHGGASWGTVPSEARPVDKSGKTIPPPPTYVLPSHSRIQPDMAYGHSDKQDRVQGPDFSAPGGVDRRYEVRPTLIREVVEASERPSGRGWIRREPPPHTELPYRPRPGGPGPGSGGGDPPQGGGPSHPPGPPPPGYTSW